MAAKEEKMPYMTLRNAALGTEATITVPDDGVISVHVRKTCRRRLRTPPLVGGPLGEVPEIQTPREFPGAAYRFEAREDGSVQAVLLESEAAHGQR